LSEGEKPCGSTKMSGAFLNARSAAEGEGRKARVILTLRHILRSRTNVAALYRFID
jgi:hypothetical protein